MSVNGSPIITGVAQADVAATGESSINMVGSDGEVVGLNAQTVATMTPTMQQKAEEKLQKLQDEINAMMALIQK